MPGHHEPSRPGGERGPRHRAEVVRIGHLVEDHEHVRLQEPVGVRVGIAVDLQRQALVLARAEQFVELVRAHGVHRQVLGDEAGDGVEGRRGRGELVGSPPGAGPERSLDHVAAVQPLHGGHPSPGGRRAAAARL